MASLHGCSEDNCCCPSHAMLKAVIQNSVVLLENAIAIFGEFHITDSLSQCNDEGETLLVIAMKGKNFDFIEKLMHVWIKCVRSFNQSYVISLFNQLSHHIPIVELIGHLIIDIRDEKWLQCLGLYFMESTSFTRQDKIVALELIGAASIITCPSQYFFGTDTWFVMKCWRQAMTLRFLPGHGEPIPKTPAVCVSSVSSDIVFRSSVEVMTMEELNLLEKRPIMYFIGNTVFDAIVTQALLVIRRYSSQNNLGHPYWLYLHSLMLFAEKFIEGFNGQETPSESKPLVNIYLFILEQLNGFDPKFLPRKTFNVFTSAIALFATLFRELLDESDESPAREELNYKNLLAPTECISNISKYFSNPAMISSVEFKNYFDHKKFSLAEIIFNFLIVLDEISPQISNQENQKLEEYYSNYIRNFFPHRTSTVLHVTVKPYECVDVSVVNNIIQRLLKLGANRNAVDEHGQTPLHFMAAKRDFLLEEWFVPIFRSLVDADTHLDTATDDGETVISILKKNLSSIEESGEIAQPYFESLANTLFPLRCYCARVIRRHGIPFDEDRLPFHLQSFVAMHSFVEEN